MLLLLHGRSWKWRKKTKTNTQKRHQCFFIASHITQSPKANSAFHPSGVGKRVPASAGKAKAGTRGVQVNCEIPWECVPYLSAVYDEALYKSTFTFTLPTPCVSFTIWKLHMLAITWACPHNVNLEELWELQQQQFTGRKPPHWPTNTVKALTADSLNTRRKLLELLVKDSIWWFECGW